MTTIPLSDEDLSQLGFLALAWDVTPQEALRAILAGAYQAEQVLNKQRGSRLATGGGAPSAG